MSSSIYSFISSSDIVNILFTYSSPKQLISMFLTSLSSTLLKLFIIYSFVYELNILSSMDLDKVESFKENSNR